MYTIILGGKGGTMLLQLQGELGEFQMTLILCDIYINCAENFLYTFTINHLCRHSICIFVIFSR